jgi:two-component system, NtrC family, response regulator PilR
LSKSLALIVDDEPALLDTMTLTLIRTGLAVETAMTLAEAKAKLAKQKFDLCFTDMRLPDGSGLDLVTHICNQFPDTPVAMITAYGNQEAAVSALKAGAFDFVSKPVDLSQIRTLVASALKLRDARPMLATAKAPENAGDQKPDATIAAPNPSANEGPRTEGLSRLLGESTAILEMRGKINKVARSQAPVHIYGESGTGKELVARAIHDTGPRAGGPFIPVNCGAIPSELMESEFFGHKKGSFTGAVTDKDGLFKAASGGTLFLDEVAELPMHMQVKLLRVLQEKSVRPIGANAETQVDVRLLSATHKDLSKLVELGQFRQDLFYRINVIELKIPPLRDRGPDTALLAEHFLTRLASDWGITKPRLSEAAKIEIDRYDFPGNVRELQNVLERAVAMSENDIIEAHDLQLRARTGTQPAVPADAEAALRLKNSLGLMEKVEELERDTLLKALEDTRWNRTAAAKKLNITFRAMRYRLKKLGIE